MRSRFSALALTALLLCTSGSVVNAQQSNEDLRKALTAIVEQLQGLLAKLPPPVVEVPTVKEGDDLQKALDAGGVVTLSKGAKFSATRFTVRKSGTTIIGNGATITGTAGPAIAIAPDVDDITINNLTALADYSAVIQCGDNTATTQSLADQVPQRITFNDITIPTHRGKRGFEINCSATINNGMVSDVWSTALQDSQAINILNTCGPVSILGGTYIAASENILLGGDTLKITNCPEGVVTDVLLDGLTLSKPESWRTDGVKRAVKNILELKAGKRVTVRNTKLSGSWGPTFQGAQDGSAIVITPKNGQYIGDVIIENVDVDRAAGGFQLMGKDYNSVTPIATTGVVVRSSSFKITKTFGGRGVLALVVSGMQAAQFENNTVVIDGNTLVMCDTQTPVGTLSFTGSRMTTGPYGVMAPGVNFGGVPTGTYALRPCVTFFETNTLADAPAAFKKNFPNNTYVDRATFDQLIAPSK